MNKETGVDQYHLQFLQNLDEINKAIQGTSDLQQMMSNVLDVVLAIYECDRAFLLYPCDPDASSYRIPMARTKAEYPGAHSAGLELPMTKEVANMQRFLLDTDGAVHVDSKAENILSPDVARKHEIKSYLAMAIYPRIGKPWIFGIHQCSHPRKWSSNEKELAKVVGHRIADSLSVLLSYQELSGNRTFLENIIENIPNMIFVKDAQNLRFIRFNKAGEQLLGYSRQELLGKCDHDFFLKEEADYFTHKDREVLAHRKLVDIPEEAIHTKHGERFLHTKKIPLYDENGKPAYLLGISEDITEQKRMYQELKSSEERLSLAAEAAHMGMWEWNIITDEVVWSDQCKALYDFPLDTTINARTFMKAVHPDDRDFVRTTLNSAVAESTGFNITKRNIWTDGSIHWLNTRGQVLCDNAGKATRMVGVAFDVTELKQMEQTLIQREREFRALAENSPDNIIRYDTDCRAVYVNPMMEKTLGIPASKMIGSTSRHTPGEQQRKYQAKLTEVLLTGESTEVDVVLPDKGEGLRYHNVRFVAERGEDGTITGVLAIGRDVTERKQMEESLALQEQEFRTLAENSPDNIARYDTHCRTLYVNPILARSNGLKVSEMLGITPTERNADIQYRKFQEKIIEVINTGEPAEIDMVMPDKGEGVRYQNVRVVAERGVDGEITGVLALGRDVTESRLAEAKLKESEERFRTFVDHAADAFFLHSEGGIILDVNRQACESLGYSREELIGRTPRCYDASGDFDFVKPLVDGLPTGEVIQFDTVHRRKDGSTFPVEVRCRRFSQRDQTLAVFLVRDIAERKRVEEKLRNLSQAIEQSPVSIVITDITPKIEFVNTAFTQVTGYTYDEVLGQNPSILKSHETPAEEYTKLWKSISSGGIWQGELCNCKKNGDLFWEDVTIAPVKNPEGVISHYVAVKTDVTERKKLEAQLRQSQKMEAVGQLAGGVAHDFNNMLGVIIGHAELAMIDDTLNESLRTHFEAIREAGLRSSEITQQLLAFARKQTILPKVLDLNDILEGMFKLLRRLIGEDIDLIWLPGANLWSVKMDPSQIDQILVNLCINARDAIGGVGKVTIETHNVTLNKEYCAAHEGFTPGEYVTFTVSDNGSGIDSLTKERIFEPFFTTKAVGKGTGLGLSTVYGIVRQNGGFINVYSEMGHGTAFKVYLPRHRADVDHDEPEAVSEPRSQGGYETILVVEDELLHLEMVTHVLGKHGYNVLVASSPAEAIQKVLENPGIDLLLSDVILPEMNGPELAQKVLSSIPEVCCLFMSGYTANVIVHHGVLKKGFNFIQKPFSMQELVAKVREVLDSGG